MYESTDEEVLQKVLAARLRKRFPSSPVIGGKSAFKMRKPRTKNDSDKPAVFGMTYAAR